MPRVALPTNDNARSQFLKKCISAATPVDGPQSTDALIPSELIDKGSVLLPVFDRKLSDINSLLSRRSKEVAEKQDALNELNMWLRDFWDGLRRRTRRFGHPTQVLTFYQLPLSGATPQLSKEKDMLEIARRVVDGEASAVAEGYPPMLSPSAAELKTVLEKAWKEVNEVPLADEAYDKAQEEIAGLRTEVDELIRDIYDYMKFNLRKKERASQRRIMLNYGFSFRYLKGDAVDETASVE